MAIPSMSNKYDSSYVPSQEFGYNILLGPNKNIKDAKSCVWFSSNGALSDYI